MTAADRVSESLLVHSWGPLLPSAIDDPASIGGIAAMTGKMFALLSHDFSSWLRSTNHAGVRQGLAPLRSPCK